MSENIIGIIVCVSMVICGLCTYFIGLTQGIKIASKWLLEEEEMSKEKRGEANERIH